MNASDNAVINGSSCDTSEDRELAQVLDQCMSAVEAGRPPAFEQLIRDHPRIADRLRACLASLQLLEQGSPGFEPAVAGAEPGGPARQLGDFLILREVGRGGMGIVYEAEQISLGRRVALKVLPFAATMDTKQLQRFHNEAKAAACLHHEHIIPVYFVGCERGVHFYAMQFIEGLTLAQFIQSLKPTDRPTKPDANGAQDDLPTGDGPTVSIAALSTEHSGPRRRGFYRQAALLLADAADALEYAHSLGIVHRDIKPANLLLQPLAPVGERGGGEGVKLWVGDFGLAKMGPDAGLTMSGDLLGTLRYMAPEQALARHGLVDHRADVYGLGATLYELLTLRPAVDAVERAEILRQIAFQEPRAPCKLDKAIPAELETIALKCLAKAPHERYATAGELAADLRSFVADKPIMARRPTVVQRARKAARRHPGVAVTATVALAAGLLLGVAGLAVNYWMVRQEQLRTQNALSRAEKEKAISQAVRHFLQHRLLAQADPRVQANAVLLAGGPAALKPNPTIRELLDRAAHELVPDEIDKQFPGEPLVQAEILRTIGEAYAGIGEYESAISHLERARDLQLRELAADHPDTLATLESLAKVYLDDRQRAPQAVRLFKQVRDRRSESLGRDHPDTLTAMNNLARSYFALGRHAEALGLREEIVRLRSRGLGRDHPDTLDSMNNLANSYAAGRRYTEALQLHAETLALRRGKLGKNHPDTLQSMNNLANCHAALGQYPVALKMHQETLALRRSALGADNPDTLQSLNNVASACAALGQYPEALKLHEETLTARKTKLGLDHPHTLNSMNALAWLLANVPNPALRDSGRAVALAKETVQRAPANADYQNTLGAAHYRAGDAQSAVTALQESMHLRPHGDASDGFFLAMAHGCLGDKDRARTFYDRAVAWMEKHKPQDAELGRFRAEAAELLGMAKSGPP